MPRYGTLYCMDRKIGPELNLVVWKIYQPTANLKLKPFNIKLFMQCGHTFERQSCQQQGPGRGL